MEEQKKDNSQEMESAFEDFKHENGICFWWASQFMLMLGYSEIKSFKKAIDQAIKSCITLGINHYENFIPEKREVNGEIIDDFKLTRFACYMTVMNGDAKKTQVAAAQVYFVQQTRKFEIIVQSNEEFKRIITRDELKTETNALYSTAKKAGVQNYAKFTNAGYMGMYNMYNWQLAKERNISKNNLIDYMGSVELAANVFRAAITNEKIKSFKISGQEALEHAHYEVGRKVRDMVIDQTGTRPEKLPIQKRLPEVEQSLKKGYKKMLQENKPKKIVRKKGDK